MAAKEKMGGPIQCEDDVEPNPYMVVYDTESYLCYSQNAKVPQQCQDDPFGLIEDVDYTDGRRRVRTNWIWRESEHT